jgi:threonine aldolase
MSTTTLVDLRSDTVTRPTAAMRQAMFEAPLGDDVFGDDPSVNALQSQIAEMLGFEAALFVPTGTQSNFCAILSHCQRGDEYVVGQLAHCYRWEGGGAAVFGSVQPQPLEHQPDGSLALKDIEAAIKPDDAHFARTRLLALENTIGGKLLPFGYVEAATQLAQRKGLARHLDGARLFNAAVAQAAQRGSEARAEARRIAQCFDSVSVCFSKGLGAPVGSALCGSRELIARAPPHPQDGRRRHAAGRHAGGCRFSRTAAPHRPPRTGPRACAPAGRRPGGDSRGCRSRRRRPTCCSSTSKTRRKRVLPSCWRT